MEDAQRRDAVELASRRADDVQFEYILPHCSDDQLGSVLNNLKARGPRLKRSAQLVELRWVPDPSVISPSILQLCNHTILTVNTQHIFFMNQGG